MLRHLRSQNNRNFPSIGNYPTAEKRSVREDAPYILSNIKSTLIGCFLYSIDL